MPALGAYPRARDDFDAVLAIVAAEKWDLPSARALWTIRDVAGRLTCGQEQLRHWTNCPCPRRLRPIAVASTRRRPADPLAGLSRARNGKPAGATMGELNRRPDA